MSTSPQSSPHPTVHVEWAKVYTKETQRKDAPFLQPIGKPNSMMQKMLLNTCGEAFEISIDGGVGVGGVWHVSKQIATSFSTLIRERVTNLTETKKTQFHDTELHIRSCDPLLVDLLVHHWKHGNYTFTSRRYVFQHAEQSESFNSTSQYNYTAIPAANLHASVYSLAAHLGDEDLMDTAFRKLRRVMLRGLDLVQFVALAEDVFGKEGEGRGGWGLMIRMGRCGG
ncbi:hypothetical protein CC80DRAFT_578405 [Byssothecium circinans]|uniref:Uncharacterized protein n=1 Tax=Byssothecium circinans TaxID=147558 RepID=A0A6A5THY0_9PLEO|nr:hypothetical protein CC80DRAFT_578405 [Byssothecium circinans]